MFVVLRHIGCCFKIFDKCNVFISICTSKILQSLQLTINFCVTSYYDVSTGGGYRGRIMLCPYIVNRYAITPHGKNSALITHNSARCLKKAEESIIFIFILYKIHSSWEECIFFIACWCLFAFEFLFLLLSLHWKKYILLT